MTTKTVPMEATDEQLAAMHQAWGADKQRRLIDFFRDVYRVAIAAAPEAEGKPVAWLHTVSQTDDGERDFALSFSPDNFPFEGTEPGMFRSFGCVPLYTHPAPNPPKEPPQ